MLKTFAASMAALFVSAAAMAQPAADFYKGKQFQIVVGYGAGGGYDLYARVLGRHMGAHLPGKPTVVVQNMPGAGTLRAANYVHAVAPKDGTVIGAIDRQVPLSVLLGTTENAQFKADEINWVGTLSSYGVDAFVLWARTDAPAKNLDDLIRPGGPTIAVGGAAVGSTDDTIVAIMRDVLKMNVRLVTGYPDGNSISLAVERGEIHARTADYSSIASTRPHWLKPEGGMRPLLAVGRADRHRNLPDVAIARELVKDEHARAIVEMVESPFQLARPYLAPAGIPADRLATIEKAFMATTEDPAFLAEAKKLDFDISAKPGAELRKIIAALTKAPKEAQDYLRGVLTTSDAKKK